MAIKLTRPINPASGGLANILLGNPRGYQEKTYKFHGMDLKVLLMDPTVDDNQWWKSEWMKNNPDEDRKAGRIATPPGIIPDIVIKAVYHPFDYGQSEAEKEAKANPELAGQPVFCEANYQAIAESTENVFFQMADDWAARLVELYPFSKDEEAKN